METIDVFISLIYLVSAVGFVFALKWLSHPSTARRGVKAGELGMFLAIVGTLMKTEIVEYQWIIVAMVIGGAVGAPIALLIKMTSVPQRTAFSHALGALAAGLVGTAEYYLHGAQLSRVIMTAIGFEVILGYLTFTGSLMAFGKLQGLLPGRPIIYKGQNFFNLSIFVTAVILAVYLVINPGAAHLFPYLIGLSLIFGIVLIIPIGGADMPTVIALLNGYAGLAAAAMGFAIDNKLLIIAGALDGTSGLILSIIMCRAMNRSFTNVLFGGFGAVAQGKSGAVEERTARSASPEETAEILEAATSVIIVPGYGMAVSQAQHKVRELFDALTRKGVDVRFAVHPVAGRMPGHMNVLLAEADIPYDRLYDMDSINSEFAQADVALIIGANDVVNPAARTDKTSPIFGMPILNVDHAQTVMVVKRGMATGFAGVENELFFLPKTMMLFGDAKGYIGDVVKELSGAPAGMGH
ncbi:MAG TPA: NAD(P)(+) transhydrogenase (Re/Si-specific) subunit beta [Actinomycetota bacterium]|nr:NAD(P)(+) transhydrogenase (Re/Si-specific) subunit beta [Actinomycetota bacterium]